MAQRVLRLALPVALIVTSIVMQGCYRNRTLGPIDAPESDAAEIADAGVSDALMPSHARRDFTVGFPEIPDDFGIYGTSRIIAVRVTVPEDATLETLGFVSTSGGTVRMAVYTDEGGQPSALVPGTATGPVAITTAGHHQIDIDDVALPRGSYFLAIRPIKHTVGLGSGYADMAERCFVTLSGALEWPETIVSGEPMCNDETGSTSIYAELFVGEGDEPDDVPDGGEPDAGHAVTYVGEATDLGHEIMHPPATTRAVPIDVPRATTLDALGVIVREPEGYLRMALYRDHEGHPGTLVAETGPWHVTLPGVQHVDVLDVALEPGTYWVALTTASAQAIGAADASGPTARTCSIYRSFMAAWDRDYSPNTFEVTTSPATNAFAIVRADAVTMP